MSQNWNEPLPRCDAVAHLAGINREIKRQTEFSTRALLSHGVLATLFLRIFSRKTPSVWIKSAVDFQIHAHSGFEICVVVQVRRPTVSHAHETKSLRAPRDLNLSLRLGLTARLLRLLVHPLIFFFDSAAHPTVRLRIKSQRKNRTTPLGVFSTPPEDA
jgi:hypothetical protein